MEGHARSLQLHDVNELRHQIVYAWEEMAQRITDGLLKQWHACLYTCMDAQGGQFEHKLKLSLCTEIIPNKVYQHTLIVLIILYLP